MADVRGQAEVRTPGPHWIKIAPRSALRVLPVGGIFSDLVPTLQTDPSVPQGSLRTIYGANFIELQNHLDRPLSVFLMFVQADTLNNLALLAKSAKES